MHVLQRTYYSVVTSKINSFSYFSFSIFRNKMIKFVFVAALLCQTATTKMELPYEFTAQSIIEEGRTTWNSVNDVKNLILTSNIPSLPDELIVLFLLSCNNVLKDTESTIKAYFRIKHAAPEMFSERDVDREDLKKAAKTMACSSIPVRMRNNTVIHFFKFLDTRYQNFELVPIMKIAYMLIDISQRYDPPNSLIVIIDMKGAGLMHLTRIRMGAVKTFLEFLQEAMPLKIETIHILNANYIFDRILALIKAFMKSDLMSILKTHPADTDMEQFFRDYIPKEYFPSDYGGDLKSAEELNQASIEQFRELKPFFEFEENLVRLYKNEKK